MLRPGLILAPSATSLARPAHMRRLCSCLTWGWVAAAWAAAWAAGWAAAAWAVARAVGWAVAA
jgi:hypothetical protein